MQFPRRFAWAGPVFWKLHMTKKLSAKRRARRPGRIRQSSPLIPWKSLKDARRNVSILNFPCQTLKEVEHDLIEAIRYCFRVSRIKVANEWSFDDARNVSAAYWFFHDRWKGLRVEIWKVIQSVEWHDMPVAAQDAAIEIFPRFRQVAIHSALQMGLYTADRVLSNYFCGECHLPVEKMDDISREARDLMGRDVANSAVKLQAELGEISEDTLNGWERTLKAELRAMERARQERARALTTAVNRDASTGPGGGTSNQRTTDKIPSRAQTAADQYQKAAEALDKDHPTDREAYDLLEKTYNQGGATSPLPPFSTWTSYLRPWRRATGQQKNKLRSLRRSEIGSSIVRSEDL